MSIDAKIGCAPQTVNGRVRKPEIDSGKRPGISGEMADLTPAADRPCHLL